ncbi:MAG: hypothetical protein NTU73_15055 [Ignavibacteriae bacterium]|nr:hypothetical protein [Ignavibacteriota bacterium]
MKIFLINIFIFAFLFCNHASAQINKVTLDSLNRDNFISTILDNNVNSAVLNSRINVNYDVKKINFIIRNNYSSDVTKLTDNIYRDFNDFNATTNYKLSKNFKSGIGIQYRTLSDNRGLDINKDRNTFYYTNFDYKPNNTFYINSKIGIRNEEQIGEKNSGLGGILSSEFNGFNLYNFISDGNLNLSYDKLTQKTNYNYELNTNVYKRFTDKSENSTVIRFYDRRSDFYIPATSSIVNNYNVKNNIQSRIESNIYVEDKLRYGINDYINFNIFGVYISKFINSKYRYISSTQNILFENIYNAKVNENGFQAGSNLELSTKKYYAKLWLVYSERVEQHNPADIGGFPSSIIRELERLEKDKDNNSKNTSLVIEANANLTNTHSFRFSGSSSILKYDTDSKENFDDRDELNSIVNISHKYSNLRNFILETTFEYNMATLSYLFKEKSSNNNTNKIYRLTSRSVFSPVNSLLTKNSLQVLANYTVYKFEDIISKIQSITKKTFLKDLLHILMIEN